MTRSPATLHHHTEGRLRDSIAVPKYRDALVRTMVCVSADAAISTVMRFGGAPLVTPYAGCNTDACTCEFRTVHEYAREALTLATDLRVEIAHWCTCAEDCTCDLGECRAIAGTSAVPAGSGTHRRCRKWVRQYAEDIRFREALVVDPVGVGRPFDRWRRPRARRSYRGC